MLAAINQFAIEGIPVSQVRIKSGHINDTYLIETDLGVRYILQKLNSYVFPNVQALVHNLTMISSFLSKNSDHDLVMIQFIPDRSGRIFYVNEKGEYWRIYRYIENSICLQHADVAEDFYECARAFGRFQYELASFPAGDLEETIRNFHDTPARYEKLRIALGKDEMNRSKLIREELHFVFSRETEACKLQKMKAAGEVPVRVTHNDTKMNNVLLDADTRKAICVIDLDTVMPGLSAYDFGDAIRFGASTSSEDERDLSRITLDADFFRAFVKGYLESCPCFTQNELSAFPQGAIAMTIECGVRFLTDYLEGDKYFSTDYTEHNLVRARAQFKLAYDMECKMQLMKRIVEEEQEKLQYICQ